MEELRRTIQHYTDSELITQVTEKNGEYTPEALAIMKEEAERRGLDPSLPAQKDAREDEEPRVTTYKSEDFAKFDHAFKRTDLQLATAVLRENAIPFFVDNPTSSDMLPTETEADRSYTINIPKVYADKAHALLDEHFIKADNRYLLRYEGARERLKAFNFSDIHLTESESLEELEVHLSAPEKQCIVTLGRRLYSEAESVEKAQERVLFYYDSIEDLIDRLQDGSASTLSRNDLLTMLEILQVYVDDPALPSSMDEAISSLLGFFIG